MDFLLHSILVLFLVVEHTAEVCTEKYGTPCILIQVNHSGSVSFTPGRSTGRCTIDISRSLTIFAQEDLSPTRRKARSFRPGAGMLEIGLQRTGKKARWVAPRFMLLSWLSRWTEGKKEKRNENESGGGEGGGRFPSRPEIVRLSQSSGSGGKNSAAEGGGQA